MRRARSFDGAAGRIALVVGLACCAPHGAATTTGARPAAGITAEVPLRSRFEFAFDLPDRAVAPDDVAVRARFEAPSGAAVTTGGFASHGRFVVRFTPRELGPHTFVVRADAGRGEREVARGAFVAVASDRPGFVRRDPAHPHRLVRDGATVFVLGENRINVYDPSWNFRQLDTVAYVRRMAKYGMTAIRVFIPADCESETAPRGYQIGCLEPEIGRFDQRTGEALDTLFDAAEANGIDVILVAYAIGFTPGEETWRSWADNPYSRERGGPARSPEEFFSSPALRARAMRKLRYIADRWAHSTRLLAVDLLNEPEWDGPIPERVWIPWAEQMSRAFRAADPYGHLVTVGSVGLQWNVGGGDERPWYASTENDLVEWHLYGKEFYEPHALANEMSRKVEETWGYGKPVFCGEFAYGGEDKATYDHTHAGIWSLLFSGAGALAHSAPPFEIDSDEPMTDARAEHFRVLSTLLKTFAPTAAVSPRRDARLSGGGRVWMLADDDGRERAVWVLAPNEGYGSTVGGATVSFPAPPPGSYFVRWIDDVSGDAIATSSLSVDGGARDVTLQVPPFRRHVAARVGSITAAGTL